jgi:hypothetical protein
MPAAFCASISTLELPDAVFLPRPSPVPSLGPASGTELVTLVPTDLPAIMSAELTVGGALTLAPANNWFDSREFEFSAADHNPTAFSDAGGCVYPDSYLRSLGGGPDECRVLLPGDDRSAIVTLPFLAASGWVLAICGIAGLRRAYGKWRIRRWVRRLHALGLVFLSADSRSLNSRGRSRSRRYAGRLSPSNREVALGRRC